MAKAALITGATSGIGAAFARVLAERSYDLLLTGRRREQLNSHAEDLRNEFGVRVETVVAELSDPDGVDRVVETAKAFAQMDLVINNAGYGMAGLFYSVGSDDLVRMIDVHVSATVRITRALIPGMIRAGTGAVINVSSVAGFYPLPRSVMYSSTKGFLITFSKALAVELAPHGISVQALCPGMTHTDFHRRMEITPGGETGRRLLYWMKPERVARLALKHLSSKRVVYVPGIFYKTVVLISRLLPWSLYFRLMAPLGKPDNDVTGPTAGGKPDLSP